MTKNNFQDLLGQTFGELTVLSRAPNGPNGHSRWWCQCSCGNYTEVYGTNLKKQMTINKSCGCLKIDSISKANTKHGLNNTVECRIYRSMIRRCYDIKDEYYYCYGGRGITVCDDWLGENGLINFIRDIGFKQFEDDSLERVNVNLGYSKSNCKWIPKNLQSRNRNYNKIRDIAHADEIRKLYKQGKSLHELSILNNCCEMTIRRVINNTSWI